MQRRKFIAGLGSLTAAGAAGIGTGAFNTVRADRTMSVNVAGDASAFVGLRPSDSENAKSQNSNGAYARQSGDTLEITFNANAGAGGDGLNEDAESRFYDVFEITNNGVNDVFVWVEQDTVPDGVSIIASSPPAVDSGDAPTGTNLAGTQEGKLWDSPPTPHPARNFIPVGESMDAISINVDTSDGGLTEGEHSFTIRAERKSTFSEYENFTLSGSE